jgi:hypothetical protein
MKIPEPTNSIAALIDESMPQEKPRPHLGCSLLGHHCERYLWLNFRWAVIEKFSGRILRLFRRGQNEEDTIYADLKRIGLDVSGSQHRVDFGNHISGSIDGVINEGVPEAPTKRHVLECKTHSKKSFDDLVKNGVEKSKPMHYVQMQLYMHGLKIDRALYYAVCKDNDEIYTERVRYVKETAEKYINRGHTIVSSDRMPPPYTTDPTYYSCKWCPAHDLCFGSKMTKEVNCRTCCNSTAMPDSTWKCEKYGATIPVEAQHEGCDGHVLHPDLVNFERVESNDQWKAIYIINGKRVENGEPDANVYSSKEIIANPDGCAMDDEFSREARVVLGARVVG